MLSPGAFYECKSIKELTIPASVTSVNIATFAGMEKLETIRFEGDDFGELPEYVFDGTKNVTIICKKDGKMAEYAEKNKIKYTVE